MLTSEDWDALALAHIELALHYAQCAARHQSVVRAYADGDERP